MSQSSLQAFCSCLTVVFRGILLVLRKRPCRCRVYLHHVSTTKQMKLATANEFASTESLFSTNLVVSVFILFNASMTVISSSHTASLSVFPPPTPSFQAAAPKMSGQIIRSLLGKLERMFSSQKPGSV